MKRIIPIISLILYFSTQALGAALDSYCVYSKSERKFNGKDMAEVLPIASVSKIFTTQWAIAKLGPNFRFTTEFTIAPDAKIKDAWTVHIKGAHHPYFDKMSMHTLVAELNRMKIYHISVLSFDENVDFLWDAKGGFAATLEMTKKYPADYPTPTDVLETFKAKAPFTGDEYYANYKRATAKGFKNLIPNPKMKVDNIKLISASSFAKPKGAIVKKMYSAPLTDILREMNRNSNNHAANQIFEFLGGEKAFNKIKKNLLRLNPNEVFIVNGSGGPKRFAPDYSEDNKIYNKANCIAVVKSMAYINTYLSHPNINLNLQSVLPVAGEETANSLDGSYNHNDLDRVLIGKTGTANQAVTLAGFVKAHVGDIYFYYNMAITKKCTGATWKAILNCRKAARREGRIQIKAKVTELIKKHYGGGLKVEVKPLN
jgi:serine-type D-Ala-D-Ala carboxypeptidase/endopeptidase (penicillin-binding protein 4)